MSSTGIALDSNFRKLSSNLGGLRLNGNISQGTAISGTFVTIDDPAVKNYTPVNASVAAGYLRVAIGNNGSGPAYYYLPLYQ